MNKTQLHGSQLLVQDDLIDFVQLLDEVAIEDRCVGREGKTIFMGEIIDEDHPRDYSKIREESAARQEGLKEMAQTTATFLIDLADSDIDRRKAPEMVEDFVKKLLLNEAKRDSSIAEQIFDKATAKGLLEVGRLEQLGLNQAAFEKMQEVEAAAPGGGYCSGGSCGLESVDITSIEGLVLKEKLNAKAGDTIVKDKERSCMGCGKKDIVYAYNKNKVNKHCTHCGISESKKTKA